jgi:hypothetical protein
MPYEINTNFNAERTSELNEAMSYANGVSFTLVMDRLKYPNVEYTIQTVSLPDLSINGAPLFTPQRNITAAPDKVDYGSFEITFLVDEYLKNYQEIHDWMLGLVTTTDDTKEHKKTRDLTLQVLTSHNNVAREIVLVDAYPISLSSLPFDTTITDTNYLVASVSFNYSYFKFL